MDLSPQGMPAPPRSDAMREKTDRRHRVEPAGRTEKKPPETDSSGAFGDGPDCLSEPMIARRAIRRDYFRKDGRK